MIFQLTNQTPYLILGKEEIMNQQNVFWRNLLQDLILDSFWNESFEITDESSVMINDGLIEILSKSVLLSNVIGALIG